jgi:hypothetical protein
MASIVDTRSLNNKGLQRLPAIDKSTWAPSGVEYAHHEVHAGMHFFIAQGYAVGDTEVRTIWFKTGNDGSFVHIIPEIIANGAYTLRIVEGATNVIAPDVVPLNNRRMSGNVSAARWSTSAVAATGGTVLTNLLVGVAAQGNKISVGGDAGAREEMILKADTLYAFEITAGAADINVNFILEWYEHTDKE